MKRDRPKAKLNKPRIARQRGDEVCTVNAFGVRDLARATRSSPISPPSQCERATQELAIARGQHNDYQARIGQPFPHAGFLDQLAGLCDQLKGGLSGAERKEGEPTVADLAEQSKALRTANTLEATPERTRRR